MCQHNCMTKPKILSYRLQTCDSSNPSQCLSGGWYLASHVKGHTVSGVSMSLHLKVQLSSTEHKLYFQHTVSHQSGLGHYLDPRPSCLALRLQLHAL